MMKTTLVIQSCLQRFKLGDTNARDELIAKFSMRLREMTRRMVLARREVVRDDDFEEAIGEAVNRLRGALAKFKPKSVDSFFQLGATHLRSELKQLSESHFHSKTTNRIDPADGSTMRTKTDFKTTDDSTVQFVPDTWAEWCQFHEAADQLPRHERNTFDLLWYHGLTLAEAAEVMNVSEQQMKRYWNSARLVLKSNLPECVQPE